MNSKDGLTCYKHVAPLGLGVFCYPVCYKHVAPLGLNDQNGTDSVASHPCGVLLMPIDGRFLASCSLR